MQLRGTETETMLELTEALKLCLESEGLSWEAEHEGEVAQRRINLPKVLWEALTSKVGGEAAAV
jgi:hypothetical protein